MTIKLYHVSSPINVPSILRDGLIAGSSGKIFLFDNLIDAAKIALDQCGLHHFSIFQVFIENLHLYKDKVAEVIQGNQFFIKTERIDNKKIKFITCKGIIL